MRRKPIIVILEINFSEMLVQSFLREYICIPSYIFASSDEWISDLERTSLVAEGNIARDRLSSPRKQDRNRERCVY